MKLNASIFLCRGNPNQIAKPADFIHTDVALVTKVLCVALLGLVCFRIFFFFVLACANSSLSDDKFICLFISLFVDVKLGLYHMISYPLSV
jgi:hypothetical protein